MAASVVSDLSDLGLAADAYFAANSRPQRLASRRSSFHAELAKGAKSWAGEAFPLRRRLSHDATARPRKFLMPVDETLRLVLAQEDTNGDFQVTVLDDGPKIVALGTAASDGHKSFEVRGTYQLSVLIQELALAKEAGRRNVIIHEDRLNEDPVERLSRMVRTHFWPGLTRQIDADGIEAIMRDPKNRSEDQRYRIYVPETAPGQIEYYRRVAMQRPQLGLIVEVIPKGFGVDYFRSIYDKPGILALAMREETRADGTTDLQGLPFIVPGARFNELYNWDSYFTALGLLIDNRADMVENLVEHFAFCIEHYGKMPNGSRTYYLMRAQPPFLTDMALQLYARWRSDPDRTQSEAEDLAWLKRIVRTCIREYHTYWMTKPLDPVTGLARYRPDGAGIPPECEEGHFQHVLAPYAKAAGLDVETYTKRYNDGEIKEPKLDDYFMHDRAVRESGHDTSYRLEDRCADMATIDLNSLLFKYEVDIAYALQLFGGELDLDDEPDFGLTAFPFGSTERVAWPPKGAGAAIPASIPAGSSRSLKQTRSEWLLRAARRRQLVDRYLWDEKKGLYYDYDCRKQEASAYETVTSLWALYAGLSSKAQAAKLVANGLPKFEEAGGLVPGTEESRGIISPDRQARQWDFPNAWPPHQIMAWIGLERYGFVEACQRIAYRWAFMLTTAFYDHHGMVPEKFDAVAMSHRVTAEYGNQGTDFHLVPSEGFGWMNASYVLALSFLAPRQRKLLGMLASPEAVFRVLPGTGERDESAPQI